jgi:hypothetical protein
MRMPSNFAGMHSKLSVNPFGPKKMRNSVHCVGQRKKSRKKLFFNHSTLLLQSGPLSKDAAKCTDKYGEVHARSFTCRDHKFLPKIFHLIPSSRESDSML